MRNLKKFLAVLVVVVMIATTIVPAFAADSYTYSDQAQKLYDLNLFKGLSDTTYDPGLGLTLDRQTGVVMLLRLIGKEAAATAMSDADATAALANFTDKGDVVDWAMKSMAYAVKNGLVQGMDSNVLGPKTSLTGKMYATMILRNLGYTVDNTAYLTAAATLAEKGGLTAIQAVALNDKAMIRDDLVGMSFGALQAKYSTGTTVIDKLIADGVVTADKAVAAGVSSTITALANPADITVITGGTITLPTTVTATLSNASTKDVTVTWDKTVDANVVGTTTLTGTVAGTTLTAALKVIVNAPSFAVTSVTELNANTIKVSFNRNVDKTSAQSLLNYKINGTTIGTSTIFGGASVKFNVVGADVFIYTGAAGLKITNDVSFNFEVNGVLDSTFNLAPIFKTVISGNDTTAPAIASITSTAGTAGTTNVTVAFTEPVNFNYGTYRVNGISASATPKTGKDSHKVALVTQQTLVAGTEYTLVVSGVSDGINTATTLTQAFTVTADNVGPSVVSAIQVSDKIVVTFDESISANDTLILVPDSDYSVYKTGDGFDYAYSIVVDPDNDKNVNITLNPSNPIFTGTQTTAAVELTLKNIKDKAGNVLATTYKQSMTLVKDTVAPTLSSAILNTANNHEITLTFSEPVAVSTTENQITVTKNATAMDVTGYYVTGALLSGTVTAIADSLVKADGTPVSGTTTSSTYVKLILASSDTNSNALDAGDYTFYIPEGTWKDPSLNNIASTSFTVTATNVSDSTKPTVTSITSSVSNGKNVLRVTFSEKVNLSDAININNYAIDGLGLAAGTQITSVDDTIRKSFDITIPLNGFDSTTTTASVTVSNVRDVAGNIMDTAIVSNVTLVDTKKLTLVTAEAGAVVSPYGNKVTLTFSENIGDYSRVSGIHFTITDDTANSPVDVDLTACPVVQIIGKKLLVTLPASLSLNPINFAIARITVAAGAVSDQAGNGIAEINDNASFPVADKFIDAAGASAAILDLVYSPTNNFNDPSEIMFRFTEPTNKIADGIVKYKVYLVTTIDGVVPTLTKDNLTASYTPVVYWNRAQIYNYLGSSVATPTRAFLGTDFNNTENCTSSSAYFSDGTAIRGFDSANQINGYNVNVGIFVIAEDRAGNSKLIVDASGTPGTALNIAD